MPPFDPDAFMATNVDQALDDQYVNHPIGEFRFMVDSFDSKVFKTMDRSDGSGTFTTFEIPLVSQDDAVKARMSRDKVTVRYKGFLDFDSNGQLDFSKGKNVKLGMLRTAVGQNEAGKPWNFQMLSGAGPIMGKVVETSDKKDSTIKYTEVSRVTKIS